MTSLDFRVRWLRFAVIFFAAIGASVRDRAQGLSYPAADYVAHGPGRSGGVLHTSAGYEPGSLDIHQRYEGNLLWEGRLLFDSLVYLDAKGEPVPWLAKSWTVSPDGCIYTFHLREDVTFSDGTRFDAEAVRVNFERIQHLSGKSRIAATYLAPYREGKVLDPHTFVARLDQPYPAFLSFLAQTWMGFISPKQILGAPESIATHAIGTGPFVLSEYEPGKRAVFRRRDDYAWAPAQLDHRGPAYLDAVVLEGIRDEPARKAGLLEGRQELCFEPPLGAIAELRTNTQLVVSNRIRAGSPMRSLAFNPRRFPFDDVRIRRAVALALDRVAQVRLIAGREFLPKSDYLGSNTPGYDPSFKDALAYDPAKADAILDDAGYAARDSEGFRVKDGRRLGGELLTTGTERTPPVTVVAMQSDLKKIGFELRLTFAASEQLTERVREGRYDALTGGWWSATTPDVLFLLYHGSQVARQNLFGQDTGRLRDPTLDDVLLRARRELDPVQRQALYREAQRLLTVLVPVVPLHESHHLIAYHRKLHGVVFDTVHNTPLLTAAWLEEDKP